MGPFSFFGRQNGKSRMLQECLEQMLKNGQRVFVASVHGSVIIYRVKHLTVYKTVKGRIFDYATSDD